MLGCEDVVELLAAEEVAGKHDVEHRAVVFEGFLGDGRGGFIAEIRIQGRDDADAVLESAPAERVLLAVMPLTQRSCNVRMAWRRRWMPFDSEKAMIGSMTFNSSCPASAAIVMVTSLPMMSVATRTTSG